jgi:biotin operon repressor
MTYKERKEKMEYLLERIEKGWCSNLDLFAVKSNCSKRTVERMLFDLRDDGYEIKYCRVPNRYYIDK